MAEIGLNTRLRVSPFYRATLEAQVAAFVTYNRMMLPVSYGDPAGEYQRLMTGVSQWDVGVQRQVQLVGAHPAILLAPSVVGLLRNANFPDRINTHYPLSDKYVDLPELLNNLLRLVPRVRHDLSSVSYT